MAMVTIVNALGQKIKVSNGAFENIYKQQGYRIAGETKAAPQKAKQSNATGDAEMDAIISAIENTPFSQWTKEAVKNYGELKDIDLTQAKTFTEAKATLKAAIDAAK